MKKPLKLPPRKADVSEDGSVPVGRVWTTLVLLLVAGAPVCLMGVIFKLELWPWVFQVPVMLFAAAMGALAWQGWRFLKQLLLLGLLWDDIETEDVDALSDYDAANGQARKQYRPGRMLWLLVLPPLIIAFGGSLASVMMWLGWGLSDDLPFSTILLHPLWHFAGGVWFGAVLYIGARFDLVARSAD